MKPYSRNDNTIRVRNKSKYNAVPRKKRRTGYKVGNPTNIWDSFWGTVRASLVKIRLNKSKGLKKDTLKEYKNDKI